MPLHQEILKPLIAFWGYLSRFLLTSCPKRCSQVEHYADFCCSWLEVVAVDKLRLPKSGLTVLFVVVVLLGNCRHDPDKGSMRKEWKPGSCFRYFHNSSRHQKTRKFPLYFIMLKRFHWDDHTRKFRPHSQKSSLHYLGVISSHVRV